MIESAPVMMLLKGSLSSSGVDKWPAEDRAACPVQVKA